MSIVALKTMFAAAGAGGGGYWVADVNDSTITSGSYGTVVRMDLNSSGSIAVSLEKWGANNYSAVVQLSSGGSLEWAKRITKQSSNDIGYGLAIDSSDNVYYSVIASTTTNFLVYVFDSSGSVQKVASSGGWSDQSYQVFDIYSDDIYAGVKYSTLGATFYKEDAATLTGAADWTRRYYPGNAWFPNSTYFDSNRYYVYGYRGSGTSSTALMWTMTHAGAADVAKDLTTSGSYRSIDQHPSRIAHYNGNFYVEWKQSPDGAYIDEIVLAKTAYPFSSVSWARTINYSTRGKLGNGPTLASSTGDIHCMVKISDGSSVAGLYLQTFNESGTFQRELLIQSGSSYYILGTCLIDANDDIYISGCIYNGSVYAGYKPFVMKIPSDYSSIGGTYGDWTLTYSTSSTFTIASGSASTTNATSTNDTSVSVSFGTGSDGSTTSSTISVDLDSI